jgi:NTE family protein
VVIDGWAGWFRFDIGFEAGTDLQARVGAQIGRLKTDVGAQAGVDSIDVDTGLWSARINFDRLDAASFPSTGGYSAVRVDLSRPGLGATDSYELLDWIGIKPWTWGGNTLLGAAELGTDFGGGLPVYDQFRLGGPQRLSGLDRNQLRGDKKALVNLRLYRTLVDLAAPGRGAIYGGASAELGAVLPSDTAWSLDRLVPSMSVFMGADTVIGPFYLGWGWAEAGNHTLYLTLGHLQRFTRHF